MPAFDAAGLEVCAPDIPAGGDLWSTAGRLAGDRDAGAWLGYSMGGRLALHVALSAPQVVERLALVGATAGIVDPIDRATRRETDEAEAARLERIGVDQFLERWLAQPLFAGLSEDAAGLEARRTNTVEQLAAQLRQLGTGTQDPLWSRLHELDMPVLVVAGERDGKFATLGRQMAEAIGDNASLALVPGAGHACHLERPDEFTAVVLPFLTG